jgi:hypothetical protein
VAYWPLTPESTAAHRLAEFVLSSQWDEADICERGRQVKEYLLAHSQFVRRVDFQEISRRDLELLFEGCDRIFFNGLCSQALNGQRLTFRLAPRMTRAGGKTARIVSRNGVVSYEISVAVFILFDSFRPGERQVTVCGAECANLLEALQRIFEHELVHLVENLCWAHTDCSASRFQDIARRLFLHRSHTHNLVTRRERAAASGIQVGSRVAFRFEERELSGRVNRITKRATVLVEDPAGVPYSDGLRYKTYYVPIGLLQPLEKTS